MADQNPIQTTPGDFRRIAHSLPEPERDEFYARLGLASSASDGAFFAALGREPELIGSLLARAADLAVAETAHLRLVKSAALQNLSEAEAWGEVPDTRTGVIQQIRAHRR